MFFRDATNKNSSADYINALVSEIQAKHGYSLRQIAKKIGIGFSTLRDLMHGRSNHNYPTQYILESLLESDVMEKLEITIAVDHHESEQFCEWLNGQGLDASIGNDTSNYINGESTGSSEELNIKMNSLWDSYCKS